MLEESSNESLEEFDDEVIEIIYNDFVEETTIEVNEEQENVIPLKYREVVKVLEMNESSICGMNLSKEYESIIIDIANRYGVPKEKMLTIGCKESDGNWNNNGLVSNTNDYGVFQINKINHEHIEEVFGFSSEDLRYDPIKNAEAAAYLIRNIMLRSDVNDLDSVFGMYNGWTNWRNIDGSIAYVNGCNEILNNYFPYYNYENNKELVKRM